MSGSFFGANADLVASITNLGIDYVVVSDIVFESLSALDNSQGVLAIVSKLQSVMSASDVGFDLAKVSQLSHNCLYLDRIRDPGNMGTILRTAVACGFGLVFVDNCVDIYSQKVVRSAASALYYLTIVHLNDIVSIKPFFKIFCTSPLGDSLFDMNLSDIKKCVVVGNEASGIRKDILDVGDCTVSLPMYNTQSLNAAVAASVIMYKLAFDI